MQRFLRHQTLARASCFSKSSSSSLLRHASRSIVSCAPHALTSSLTATARRDNNNNTSNTLMSSKRAHGTSFDFSELQVRNDFADLAPFKYEVIDSNSKGSVGLTEVQSDLLIIPVFDGSDDSSSSGSAAEGSAGSLPVGLFDFQVSKLDAKFGNLISKVVVESQIFSKKGNKQSIYKHCIARLAGADLPHSYPKKVAIVSLGPKITENDENTSINTVVPPIVQKTKGLAYIISKILNESKNPSNVCIYLGQTPQVLSCLDTFVCSLNLNFFSDTRFKNVAREKMHSYYETVAEDGSEQDDSSTSGSKQKTANLTFLAPLDTSNSSETSSASDAVLLGSSLGTGVGFARELVNSPANIMTPLTLSKCVENMASVSHEHGGLLQCRVMTPEQCADLRMNAFLKVGACSNNEPRFVHMSICDPNGSSDDSDKENIVLIGKGVCFDSGGYNLKAGANSSIEYMKYDMAGSAAVIGTFLSLTKYLSANKDVASKLLAKYNIHGCVAACENMISGFENSMHPGDVVQAADGTTIEVNNTDAEGRLTLCDAIWFAKEIIGANVIIDIATLTGAIKVAIGPKIGGLYSNNSELLNDLMSSGYKTGERVWHMPLFDDNNVNEGLIGGDNTYASSLESEIADMKNSASMKGAGSITAGLFLQKFVENSKGSGKKKTSAKDIKWAHIDVAGPVWKDKKGMEMKHGGATGFGVRLLTNYVLNRPC